MSSISLNNNDFFIPSRDNLGRVGLWRWYLNLFQELEGEHFSREEAEVFRKYYREAGLFTASKRAFFLRHFCRSFKLAAEHLFRGLKRPRILDLGCGLGTQSLALALMGAEVIALDRDPLSLHLLKKRAAFYEKIIGRTLAIEVIEADATILDYAQIAPIHGLYSMFAFNMIQPSKRLLGQLLPHFAQDARIAIIDGNNRCWLPRIYPPRRRKVWSPEQFEKALTQHGFRIVRHEGGVSLPPLLWAFLPDKIATRVDAALNSGWFFPISHHILAERKEP